MKTALQVVRSTWKFLVIAGIVVLIHLFMVDVDWQWDMTEAQIYSLSERSVETVQNLDKSLTIMFFHTDRSMGRSPVQPSRIRRLLKQYARTSVSVSFKEIDHARNPNMAKKHGVRQNNVIVLKSGKKTKKLGPRELFKFQRRARRRRPSRKFQGEQAITKAIMKLSEATDKTVYFATGHGEVQKQRSRRGRSVSAWSRALGEEGYNVQSWNPLTDNLPDTGNLIIMMGPSRSYSKSVSKQYRKWIRRGGKLIVGVNPPSASRVNPIVEPGGMSFQSRQIVDPNRRSRASLFNPFIFVPKLGNHPSLKSLKEQG
ncbi:MAG: Gldg family protein, partial [bacterium]